MTNDNSNGARSAFPDHSGSCYGITKREWLAGLALEALITNGNVPYNKKDVSACAIEYADALLTELDKHS